MHVMDMQKSLVRVKLHDLKKTDIIQEALTG